MNSLKEREEKFDGNADPIDEDEQDEIIATVTQDFKRQVHQISKMMSAVCVGAIAATIISILLHGLNFSEHEQLLQSYPIFSLIIYTLAMKISKSINNYVVSTPQQRVRYLNFNEIMSVMGIILIMIYMVTFAIFEISDILIWTLSATNTMILLGSLYVLYDTKQTLNSINNLKSYKYKFKTL